MYLHSWFFRKIFSHLEQIKLFVNSILKKDFRIYGHIFLLNRTMQISECQTTPSGNDLQGWILTFASGLACCLGGKISSIHRF